MSCEGDDQIDEIVNSIDAVIVDAAKKNKNKSKKNTDAAPREPVDPAAMETDSPPSVIQSMSDQEVFRLIQEQELKKQQEKYDKYLRKSMMQANTEREHKFWNTQPVPSLTEEVTVNEAINPNTDVSQVKQDPYNMPAGFEWCSMDVNEESQLQEIYNLLTVNYVEDDDCNFRFDYSVPFLHWALTPPGYRQDWHVGVRATKSGALMGCITAVPVIMRVYDQVVRMVEINFLCVVKKLRTKRLAPVLIKEITRRVNLQGVWQATYTAGVVLPKPLGRCRYWHRSLNPKKLVEIRFSSVPQRMTMAKYLKDLKLPERPQHNLRLMQPEDVPTVHRLLNNMLTKRKFAPVFSVEEVAHVLLPRPGVVTCYVVESASGEVTDFSSFYHLPSTVIKSQKYTTLLAVYSFYNVANSMPLVELIQDTLILARRDGTDVFNALDLGETGSGKSTQLPQILLDSKILSSLNQKCILITQPRRVAAITIAQRIAKERKVTVGREVGYQIRFENKSIKEKTRIKLLTDGMLLREVMNDDDLMDYNIIIIDEAHERSLQTDILIGLLKQLQMKRMNDLKLIIMSATLQIDLFMNFFENPNLITIRGREYPVDVYYTREPVEDYVDAAMLTCMQIFEEEDEGGVLVFLPGQEDIESLHNLLEDNLKTLLPSVTHHVKDEATRDKTSRADCSYEIFPLYASLSPEKQLQAFSPSKPNVRKYVLATNIAETSVTISGIKYVVDSGFVKIRLLQSTTGIEMLKIVPTSKAQANQRAGRAGRESAGKCFRLYPEEVFEDLEDITLPEIQRVDIAQVILQLKSLGQQPLDFPYLSPPSTIAMMKGLESLVYLGALGKSYGIVLMSCSSSLYSMYCYGKASSVLEQDQELTDLGRKIVQLPLHPQFAYLLLKSIDFRCVAEILTAVALLSTDNIFINPHRDHEKLLARQAHKRFAIQDGDLLTLVNIYSAWMKADKDKVWATRNFISQRALLHAASIRLQLEEMMERLGYDTKLSCAPEREPFLKCLAMGLFTNIARKALPHNQNESLARNLTRNEKYQLFQSFQNKKNPVVHNSQDIKDNCYHTLRGNQMVFIHPSSVLFQVSSHKLPSWIVFSELLITSKHYIRGVTAIHGDWLTELVPNFIRHYTVHENQVEANSHSKNDSKRPLQHPPSNHIGEKKMKRS